MDSYQIVGLEKNYSSYKTCNGKAQVKNLLKYNFVQFLSSGPEVGDGFEMTGCRGQRIVLMYVTLPSPCQL